MSDQPTRVGDEASIALSHALQELRWVEAERDHLRKALKDIRVRAVTNVTDALTLLQALESIEHIAEVALAETGDDNE